MICLLGTNWILKLKYIRQSDLCRLVGNSGVSLDYEFPWIVWTAQNLVVRALLCLLASGTALHAALLDCMKAKYLIACINESQYV